MALGGAPRRYPRTPAGAALLLVVSLALGGCGSSGFNGQEVELVAGGGDQTGPSGTAADATLEASHLVDLAATADGTVWVLATAAAGPVLWTVSPDGRLRRTPLAGLEGSPTQMAVDPAGTVHVVTGRPGIWRVDDRGATSRVVGDGRLGWSPDGTAADAAALGLVGAVAGGPRGELYFAEQTSDPGTATLVRVVQLDGTLHTVAGTRQVPGGEQQRERAIAAGFKPAPSTSATEVLLFDSTQRALAVASDGTLYLTTHGGVLSVRDGAASPLLAPQAPDRDTAAAEPFAREARAGEVHLDLAGPQRPDLAVDPGGNLYLVQ